MKIKKNKSDKKLSSAAQRKLRYGGLSLALTVTFVAAILLVNAGVTFLTNRYYLKWDISQQGLYEISDQTKIMLEGLTEDVNVYILMSENEVLNSSYYNTAYELLLRYQSINHEKFHVSCVDVYKNPSFASKYSEDGTSLSTGSFVIESEKRFKVCSMYDLYEISSTEDASGKSTAYLSGYRADEAFASALHYVTTGELPTVAFCYGHDESYGSEFTALFEENNFTQMDINLLMEEIPSNLDIFVICSPLTDFTEEEIDKLDTYLTEDYGSLMFFVDVQAGELPNLFLYMEEWGVSYGSEVVCDSTRAISYPTYVVGEITKSSVSESFNYDSNTMVLTPYSLTMEVLFDEANSVTAESILDSSASSYSKDISGETENTTFAKESGDAEGPFSLATYSCLSEWKDNASHTGKVVCFGTSGVASDAMMNYSSLYNKNFITACIDKLCPETDAISVETTDLTNSSMAITTNQATAILILLVLVIPCVILVLGLIVWIRRRHK